MTQTITVDLPWPPSQNAIWRKGRNHIYRNPKYLAWIKEASWLIKLGKHKKISGQFSAVIILNPPNKRKLDLDNRIKGVLDLAQKMGLIDDDHLCRLLVVSYGVAETAPLGARLIISSM